MSRPTKRFLVAQQYGFYFLFTLKFPVMSADTPKLFHYLWECISWFSVVLPLHMAFCFLKTVYDRMGIDEMYALSNIGIQGVWLLCSFVCMFNFKRKSKDMENFINIIEDKFQWRSVRGKTYVKIERLHKYAKIVAIFWQITPTSSVVASLLRPLFKRPVELPINIWYPVNKENPYQFALAYLLQSWAQIIVVVSFAAGSSFFFSFGLLCCGQFNILRCALKNLVFTSGIYKRFPETLDLNNNQDSAEYLFAEEMKDNLPEIPGNSEQLQVEDLDGNPSIAPRPIKRTVQPDTIPILTFDEIESFRAALKDCVAHHLLLKKLCALMEDFLNFFSLLRIVELTLQMCFMAFVYVKTSDIIVLLFGVLAAVDIFLLTYPVDYICAQNNAVGSSMLMGPWYLVSEHFRGEFLIIVACSQQPIYFTAGKILVLDADRLRQAITTAFSYYTLLSSFDEA